MIKAKRVCDTLREDDLRELMQEHAVYEDREVRISIEYLENLYEKASDNSREGVFGRALADTCEDSLEDEGDAVVLYHADGAERYWRPGDTVYKVFDHLLEGDPEDEKYEFVEVEFEDRNLDR